MNSRRRYALHGLRTATIPSSHVRVPGEQNKKISPPRSAPFGASSGDWHISGCGIPESSRFVASHGLTQTKFRALLFGGAGGRRNQVRTAISAARGDEGGVVRAVIPAPSIATQTRRS